MRSRGYSLFLAVILGGNGLACAATGDDSRWDGRFFALNAKINTMAVNTAGEFIFGGKFTTIADTIPAANIARWNGQKWFALGSGVNGEVKSLATNGTDIYVGGLFTLAGGLPATNIARWDGSNWWPVGGGVSGTAINSLLFVGPDLYAGGTFTSVGGVTATNIAKWDGANWTELSGGIGGSAASVNALAWDGQGLLVGGNFTNAGGSGGLLASNIARWTGSSWESFATGVRNPVIAIARDTNGDLYVGGGKAAAGPFVARWTGTSWTYLPGSSPSSPLGALFFFKGSLYAGGIPVSTSSGLARWDGVNWITLTSPFYPTANFLGEQDGFAYLGGQINNLMVAGFGSAGMCLFDGSSFQILGAGLDRNPDNNGGRPMIRSLLVVSNALVAGGHLHGELNINGNLNQQLVANWDDKGWSRIGSDLRIAEQVCGSCGISALAHNGSNLFSGGTSVVPSTGFAKSYVRYFDGTNWPVFGGPVPGSISALTFYTNGPLVGGSAGVRWWDGVDWVPLGTGVDGGISAMITRSNEVFVGGSFLNAGGMPAANIARWDGTNWSAVGSGVDAEVNTLAFRGSDLIVGGAFTNAGGVSVNCIARWDGSTWLSLGSGFTGGRPSDNFFNELKTSVNALALTWDDRIFAGGNFSNANGHAAKFIAEWDGSDWLPLGSGLDWPSYALALRSEDLFVGGDDFAMTGDKASSRIALWHDNSFARIPMLNIQRQGEQVVISWPGSITGFHLESVTTLTNPTSWFVEPYAIEAGQYLVTNSLGEDFRVYRLRKD